MANDTVFHGSPADIIDSELKPLGWSRHLESKGVYLTDSRSMALAYALCEGDVDKDDAKLISFYNQDAQDWEMFIIVKSESTAIGYVYEVNRPTESPVSYYDAQNDTEIADYRPGCAAIWVLTHDVPILRKHIVNYNYMKQNPLHITIRILKQQQVFKDAIDEIQARVRAIDDASHDKKTIAINNFRRTLDEYTDK